jgi:hypothetical protein
MRPLMYTGSCESYKAFESELTCVDTTKEASLVYTFGILMKDLLAVCCSRKASYSAS